MEGRVAADRIPRTFCDILGGSAVLLAMMVFLRLTTCSGALPKSKASAQSPWESFEEAKTAYDSIEPALSR
jgi:hypothetical protein